MDAESSSDDGRGGPLVRKQEMLEYLVCPDGSVVCKRCGEVLPSRTHWYRHKYKLHVMAATSPGSGASSSPSQTGSSAPSSAQPMPAELFRCERCNVFFKSRRGFVGHVAARHPDCGGGDKEEAEAEGDAASAGAQGGPLTVAAASGRPERRRAARAAEHARGPEYERQRQREEKMVADIIEKVRRECEAQGEAVSRRGYSRRSTVMNS